MKNYSIYNIFYPFAFSITGSRFGLLYHKLMIRFCCRNPHHSLAVYGLCYSAVLAALIQFYFSSNQAFQSPWRCNVIFGVAQVSSTLLMLVVWSKGLFQEQIISDSESFCTHSAGIHSLASLSFQDGFLSNYQCGQKAENCIAYQCVHIS